MTPTGHVAALLAMIGAAGAAAAFDVPDTMAQRLQACTACHGKEGRATADGYYPRIAGKPAGYLFNQLVAFRDGRRANRAMALLLAQMDDGYLRRIAGHFAALELPYPPPLPAAADRQELARGEALVREGDAARGVPACTVCHGAALTGVQPAAPGLLGLPRDYLGAQLGAWRAGARRAAPPDCMERVARALDPTQIGAVTAWLASQPVPADARPANGAAAPPPLECGSLWR